MEKNQCGYFLICFAQTKITLFIFFDNWVIKKNENFLLVEPCSGVPKSRGNFLADFDVAKFFGTDNSDSRLSLVYP